MSTQFEPGSTFRDFRIVSLLAEDAGNQLYAVERLGEGAALRVYTRFGKQDAADSAKLAEAALAGAAVGSSSVPAVRLAGIDGTTRLAWVAMEPLAGVSLARLISERAPFDSNVALDIVQQIADALARAHAAEQVHGELAPASVMVLERPGGGPPALRLLDLGALRWLNERGRSGTQLLGAPQWQAPEQLTGASDASAPADVWALGLLAFRLLAGVSYWRNPDSGTVAQEITVGKLPSASERAAQLGSTATLPPGFDEWFARCVARNPEERFPHAGEAATALRKHGATAGASAPPAGAPPWTAPAAEAAAAWGPPRAPDVKPPHPPPAPPPAFATGYEPSAPPPRDSGGSGAAIAIAVGLGLLAVFGVFALAVIGGAFYFYTARSAPPPPATAIAAASTTPASHGLAPVPVTDSDPSWGDVNAPVTIVEFTDLECPFCARVHSTLEELKTSYGPSELRIVVKHNPLAFHKRARGAAEAAERVRQAGGNGAFWQFVDRAYANRNDLNEASYESWATAAGVDPLKYRALIGAPSVELKIDDDIALAKRLGAKGTPAFRINGVELSGAQPLTKFKSVIDDQLAEARRRIASGTPASEIYPTLTRENFRKPAATTKTVAEPDEDRVWNVPVLDDDPQLGPSDALVTVVEFGDFQCPFCKRVQPALQALRDDYGADLRIVWKDNPLPFHTQAEPAAQLARVIYDRGGDKAFWSAHDQLFEKQPKLSDDDLRLVASSAGLSWAAAEVAMSAPSVKRRIKQNQQLAQDLKARGTPTCFVNGRVVKGAQPLDKFKDVVERELTAARTLVARGTPRSQVYATIIKEGHQESAFEFKQARLPNRQVPLLGPSSAKVTVHVFSDFQCPFCARVAPTLKELLKKYPRDVRLAWHDLPLPFHKQAPMAAEAAREVQRQLGDAAFWRFHDRLFSDGKVGPLGRSDLERLAQGMGCNMTQFREALDTRRHQARVKEDADAAADAGVRGTPSFLIASHGDSSGKFYFVSGAHPLAKFERVVDDALKQ
jgi:protein-disulfide isomerase